MSLDDLISAMEKLVSTMDSYRPEVVTGKYVYARHTNVLIDFCKNALEACKKLYEDFKAKTGRALPDVEYWLQMAETRVGFMEKRKFGDLVVTKDHNLVIDSMKPMELVLQRLELELSNTS